VKDYLDSFSYRPPPADEVVPSDLDGQADDVEVSGGD
jgi:hypothetical protein